MPVIQILPEHVRNLIAAGEVIERPASVVKELVENSIDAGAENIKIEVLYGGKRLIRVTDDGCGMEKKDAILSIERYATSKISTIEDLFNIRTLGFRGEALASIASVSRLTIETGTDPSQVGTLIEVKGGGNAVIRDAPPIKGTIVTVRDLFFNTPARRKFLKTDSTELNHIIEVVVSEGLAEHRRGFRLFADNRELLNLAPVNSIKERVAQILGKEAIQRMMEFQARHEGLGLHGFVSLPPEVRSRRTGQYIFVNNRPVRDYLISKAIYEGLSEILPKDKHPLFVIYLSVDPSKVDFNVHPTKKEVRFSEGTVIYEFIIGSLKRALKQRDARDKFRASQQSVAEVTPEIQGPEGLGERIGSPIEIPAVTSPLSSLNHIPTVASPLIGGEITMRLFEKETFYRKGQVLSFGGVFVAMADEEGLIVMDRHAAHERILYERFLNGLISTKTLLFPKQVRLQPVSYRIILSLQELLKGMGIEVEDFGKSVLLVRAIPEYFREEDIDSILEDIASAFRESEETRSPFDRIDSARSSVAEVTVELSHKRQSIASTLACHRSIRRGEEITPEEIEALYRELLSSSDPYHCPHGRPTMIRISIDEIMKRFGR